MLTRFESTTIRGDGFVLRPLTTADVPAVAAACVDEQTQRWLPLPTPYTLDDARGFVEEFVPGVLAGNIGIVFGIDEGDGLVGCIDLKRTDWVAHTTETGYWVSPAARGRGVAARATRRLAEWAIAEAGLKRVEVRVEVGNDASAAVARHAGFTFEGVARSAAWMRDRRIDFEIFSLVPGDLG